jgi:hypothetical protein
MNLILVCMVCECNAYVIPKSIGRKDLGHKIKLDLRSNAQKQQSVAESYDYSKGRFQIDNDHLRCVFRSDPNVYAEIDLNSL